MKTKWIVLLATSLFLFSCRFSTSTNSSSTKEVSSATDRGPLGGAVIRNDIELDAKNVKVKEAYLMNEARELLNNNEVKKAEKIRCVVVLDTGWTKQNDKSYLGTSEKIMTEDGAVILDVPDLFKEYSETGMSAQDATAVSIIANITEKQPGVDYYKVQFRIWDKKGNGEVTGRFKFKVNE